MKTGGFSLIPIALALILVVGVILFPPIPYYEKENKWCDTLPPRLCIPKGWHLGPSLWQRLSGELEKSVSYDVYSCTQNSDCISIREDKCGCTAGGKNTAINKLYQDSWEQEHPSAICPVTQAA